MDIQQFLRDLVAGGEATAEEAAQRRRQRFEEPLPYPGHLLKGMTIDPMIAAGRMAGGDVPVYLSQPMTREWSAGWVPGSEPFTETFQAGDINPYFVEGAADIAMNAPTSGLIGGAARAARGALPDPNVLGVNAPNVPKKLSYSTWLAQHGLKDTVEHLYDWSDDLAPGTTMQQQQASSPGYTPPQAAAPPMQMDYLDWLQAHGALDNTNNWIDWVNGNLPETTAQQLGSGSLQGNTPVVGSSLPVTQKETGAIAVPPAVDPVQAQYDQMIAEMNEAFDAMQAQEAASLGYSSPSEPFDIYSPGPSAGQQMKDWLDAHSTPAAPAPAAAPSDYEKVLAWIQGGNYKSGFGSSSFEQQLVATPDLAKHFAEELINNPDLWQKELAAAGVVSGPKAAAAAAPWTTAAGATTSEFEKIVYYFKQTHGFDETKAQDATYAATEDPQSKYTSMLKSQGFDLNKAYEDVNGPGGNTLIHKLNAKKKGQLPPVQAAPTPAPAPKSYVGDPAKDAMIQMGIQNGWNREKLIDWYKTHDVGHSDDITFNKAPEAHIAPEWKAGYNPAAPAPPPLPGSPEAHFNAMVSNYMTSGATKSQATAVAKQALKQFQKGATGKDIKEAWKTKGIDPDKAHQWAMQLQAKTPPPGQQSPFQYAGNKQGGLKPKVALPPTPPLATPSILNPKPLSIIHHGPYFKEAMEWIYQNDLPIDEALIGRTMNSKYPDQQRAAGEELARILGDPSEWLPKLQYRQDVPHGIYMPADPDWRAKIPTTFAGVDPNLRSNSLAQKRADAIGGGFNPDEMFYKTTRYPQRRFFDPATKSRSKWGFSGKAPEHVSSYGNYLYPHHLSLGENVVERDFGGAGIEDYLSGSGLTGGSFRSWLQAGTDDPTVTGLIARNIDDIGGVQDQFMYRHPSQARSTYAEFDPAKRHLSDLMASYVGGINPFASGFAPVQEEPPKMNTGADNPLSGISQGTNINPFTQQTGDQMPMLPQAAPQAGVMGSQAQPTAATTPSPLTIHINEWQRGQYLQPNQSVRARPPYEETIDPFQLPWQ